MEMDDEAFARMLQQQLLDEERMLMEQQQQTQQQPTHQHDPYKSYGNDPYGQQGSQQPQAASSYDHPASQDPYNDYQQEAFDQKEYTKHLQEQGFTKDQYEANSGTYPGATPGANYRSHAPPGGGGAGYDSDNARRMLENPYGQSYPPASSDRNTRQDAHGSHPSYGSQQDAYGSQPSSGGPGYDQEDEDARLAQLMAQTGQSLRDLNFDSASRGDTRNLQPPEPTHGRVPTSSQRMTTQYSGQRNERDYGVSNPSTGVQYSEPEPPAAQMRKSPPQPQYSEPNRAATGQMRGAPNAPQVSPQYNRFTDATNMDTPSRNQPNYSDPANMGTPSRNQPNYSDPRNPSQQFSPSTPATALSQPKGTPQYTPQPPPQHPGQRNFGEDPSARQRPNRDESAHRSPKRPPVSRDDPMAAGRSPALRDEPNFMQGGAIRAAAPARQPRVRGSSPKRTGESRAPNRMGNLKDPPLGDHLPGDVFLDVPPAKKKDKKKNRGFLGGIFGGRNGEKEGEASSKVADVPMTATAAKGEEGRGRFGRTAKSPAGTKTTGEDEFDVVRFKIPKPVPRPADTIGAPKGPLPYSLTVSKDAPSFPEATVGRKSQLTFSRKESACAMCAQPAQSPLSALDKKYHNECFRCITCHELIDPTGSFAFIETDGDKQPMHRKCYAEIFGINCAVCKQSIPAGPDGKISFVKHPFFDTEQMCPRHARNLTRRCTGCHRFEPENDPFGDLNDVGRCVCLSCCRSVVVDSQDAQPLWAKVVDFFEHKLNMPIWKDFREIPILVVGYNALNDQMNKTSNVHGGASQIMTRGLCLTEHESGKRFRTNRMKFDKNAMNFVNNDVEDRGFTFFQVPDASKVNPDASVTAILCLSGLPQDLSASVLAHEATHAWIKLHPQFDFEKPIPPQVEEGCAQLIALLFLNEGLDAPSPLENNDGSGPSDAKLRQYFKFSIETDDHEIYGTGYRRAAMAYSMIGIEALMSHIVLYQDFPET